MYRGAPARGDQTFAHLTLVEDSVDQIDNLHPAFLDAKFFRMKDARGQQRSIADIVEVFR